MSEQSHIVYITNKDAGGSTWTVPVDVPFVVDEVIVKQLSYQSPTAGEADLIFSLSSDIISQPGVPLCTFTKGTCTTPGIRFKMHGKPIRGLAQFTTFEGDGRVYTISGYIGVHLEFIKYGKNCKCIDYK